MQQHKEKPAQELRKTKRKLATAERRLGRVERTRRSKSRQRLAKGTAKGVIKAVERIADNFFEGV